MDNEDVSRVKEDHVKWREEVRRKTWGRLKEKVQAATRELEQYERRVARDEAKKRKESRRREEDHRSNREGDRRDRSQERGRRDRSQEWDRRGHRQRKERGDHPRERDHDDLRRGRSRDDRQEGEVARMALSRSDKHGRARERRRPDDRRERGTPSVDVDLDEWERSREGEERTPDPAVGGESTLELLDAPVGRELLSSDLVTEMTRANDAIRERRRNGRYEPTEEGTYWSNMVALAGSLKDWSEMEPRRADHIVGATLKAQRGNQRGGNRFNFQKACGEVRITRSFEGGSGKFQKKRMREWLVEVKSYLETRQVQLKHWFPLLKAWVTPDRSLVMELNRVEDRCDALVRKRELPEELDSAFLFLEVWARFNLRAGGEEVRETLNRVTGCTPKRGESISDLMVRLSDLVGDHNDRTTGMKISGEEKYRILVGIIRKDAEIAKVIPQDLMRETNGWLSMWRKHGHVRFPDSGLAVGSGYYNTRGGAYARGASRRTTEEEYRSSDRSASSEILKDVRDRDWFCRNGHQNFARSGSNRCFMTRCEETRDRGVAWPSRTGKYSVAEIRDTLKPYGVSYGQRGGGVSRKVWHKQGTQNPKSNRELTTEGELTKSHLGHLRGEFSEMLEFMREFRKEHSAGTKGADLTDK